MAAALRLGSTPRTSNAPARDAIITNPPFYERAPLHCDHSMRSGQAQVIESSDPNPPKPLGLLGKPIRVSYPRATCDRRGWPRTRAPESGST